MNLQQLKYVVEIDRHKSITKAARSLFVSQPGVSTALKELEEELKIQIFIRTPTGVEATEVGRSFIKDSIDVLEKAEILGRRYSQAYEPSPRLLRVAGPPADAVVTALIAMVNQNHGSDESFHISYVNQFAFDVANSVEKGLVDIGIIAFKNYFGQIVETIFAHKNLEFHPIFEYPLCLAVYKDHPLVNAERIEYEALIRYPIIYTDSDFRDNTVQAMALALGEDLSDKLPPLKTIQIIDQYTWLKLLQETQAVSVLTAWNYYEEATADSGIVRLHGTLGDLTECRGWIKRRDTPFTPQAQAFIGYVENYYTQYRKTGDESISPITTDKSFF